jgi:serine/threonine protein kinase
MEKYKPIKMIGQGAYGTVVKCINTETQEIVAVKKLKNKISWAEALNLREIKALKQMNSHKNVVKIKEMSLKEEVLNVVFEYCD